MAEFVSCNKKRFLILFLIVEAIVIAVSISLISSTDPKEESQYTVIEKIPCDTLLQQREEIVFVPSGQTQVFQMPVSLMRGEAFDVRFSVDCDDTDGGLFFVDLVGTGYDLPEVEFRRTALEGQYIISDRINYSGIHPLKCELRIFTLGDVSAKVSSFEISRVHKVTHGKNIAIVCILILNAAMVLTVVAFFIRQSENKAYLRSEKEKRAVISTGFLLIVIMQMLLMVYWMLQKSNYYVDELYSMEKAQYFTSTTPDSRHLYENGDWQDRSWMEAEKWKETLELTVEESLFYQPPSNTIKSFLTDRNYNGMLNMAESLILPGVISQYPGVVLNMIFFALSQFVLFRLLLSMGTSPQIALFGVFWYGFCGMNVSMVEYTRFYVVTIFLFLLVIYLHMAMWKTDKLRKMFFCEVGALLCAYLAFRNSELIAPLFFFLTAVFTIALIIRRRFKMAVWYAIPVFGVIVAFVILKTSFMDIVKNYSEYLNRAQAFQGSDDMERIEEMLLHMQSVSFRSGLKQLPAAIQVLVEGIFGNWVFCFGFLIILMILLVRNHRKKEGSVSGYGFSGVIASTGLLFLLFMVWAFEVVPRYYSFLVAFIVSCLTVLLSAKTLQTKSTIWSGLCMIFVLLASLTTHISEKVDYIYSDERGFYQQLEKYKDTDSIVDQTLESFQRSLYDCVRTSGENRHIYPVFQQDGQIDTNEDQHQLLLWVFPGDDMSYYERELSNSGYEWSYLGNSESSEVYLFQRK